MQNNSALLVIDIQNGFMNQYTQDLAMRVEREQKKYAHVWIARLEYAKDSPFLLIRKHSGFSDVANTEELAFTPRSDAKNIVKHGYSAATPELLSSLQEQEITQIDLMGVDTNQCVLATALGLFDAGITPRIIANRCASTGGPDLHAAGIAVLREALGEHNIVTV